MYLTPGWGRRAVVALSVLTLTGCASMNVNGSVERGIDFTRYQTYNWAPANTLATGDPRLDNNRFFHERVQVAVERQLAIRGFGKAASGTPDLLLHYHASVGQRFDANGADQPYGYCDECRPFVYEAGTILLDFVDTRTNRLAWRGWAEGSMDGVIDNQQWMEEKVDEAVRRIIERLPRRL